MSVEIVLIQKNKRNEEMAADTRVAVIGIVIEKDESVGALNEILHEYAAYIIGRMGIPYRERGINIVSIAIDAPQDIINTLAGKLGKVEGISAKTTYSKM